MPTTEYPKPIRLRVNLMLFRNCSKVPTTKHWVNLHRIGSRVRKPGSQGSSGTSTVASGAMMKTREVPWFIEKLQTNCIFFFAIECQLNRQAFLTYS